MISQLVASGLALGSIYALLALSLMLINKATDVVNFAQGEMAMFAVHAAGAQAVPINPAYTARGALLHSR